MKSSNVDPALLIFAPFGFWHSDSVILGILQDLSGDFAVSRVLVRVLGGFGSFKGVCVCGRGGGWSEVYLHYPYSSRFNLDYVYLSSSVHTTVVLNIKCYMFKTTVPAPK